jgi:imidazolonepropionase-like amidohydrolase
MTRAGFALALLLAWGSAAHSATVIHAGRVIDGISDTVRTNQTVVVDAGKIVSIESVMEHALFVMKDNTVYKAP